MMSQTSDRRSSGRGALRRESGASAIRAVVTLAVVVSFVYVGVKFMPVKAAAFRFEDAVREQVVLAGVRRRRITEKQVRDLLISRASELGLPIEATDVSVSKGRSTIRIRANYVVPVQLVFGYRYDWAFRVDAEGPLF